MLGVAAVVEEEGAKSCGAPGVREGGPTRPGSCDAPGVEAGGRGTGVERVSGGE